jgi:exo-beta-1,3-glucanase (GH17 family)
MINSMVEKQKKFNGICYGPFRSGQSPITKIYPNSKQIEEDLKLIKKIVKKNGLVKTYSTLDTLKIIPFYIHKLGLKCFLASAFDQGPWLIKKEINNIVELANSGLINWVAIGDMALSRNYLSYKELSLYIKKIKKKIKIPVGASNLWEDWIKFPELVKEVDFLSLGVSPSRAGIARKDAIEYVRTVMDKIVKINPENKPIFIDSGWPSAGGSIKNATFNLKNHLKYIKDFSSYCEKRGLNYLIFEAFDEEWKIIFEQKKGAHLGVYDKNRIKK